MMVMLYTNLLTGPALVFLFVFLLWWFIPYSNYIALLYIGWVVYDNHTRPMPAPSRVKQWWRKTSMYELFRDYFPIRSGAPAVGPSQGGR